MPRDQQAVERLNNPQATHATDLVGPDATALVLAPPPAFASREMAAEMTELYWLALVREVPFRDYATDALDWIIDPGGPSERLAIAVIAIGIAATVGLYLCTPIPRSVLFWSAFDLSGTWAALGGHVLMKSVECSTENAGASCRLGSISLKPQQSNGPIVENGFRTDRVKASTW